MKRKSEDKRRAVETLLRDAEWGQWPETKMADICKVSRFLVRTVISENPHLVEKQDSVRLVERNGTIYTQNTANIGHSSNPGPLSGFGCTLVNLENEAPLSPRLEEMVAISERARPLDSRPSAMREAYSIDSSTIINGRTRTTLVIQNGAATRNSLSSICAPRF